MQQPVGADADVDEAAEGRDVLDDGVLERLARANVGERRRRARAQRLACGLAAAEGRARVVVLDRARRVFTCSRGRGNGDGTDAWSLEVWMSLSRAFSYMRALKHNAQCPPRLATRQNCT